MKMRYDCCRPDGPPGLLAVILLLGS